MTAMSHQRIFGEIVTKFFLDTCRLRPEVSEPAVQAVGWSAGTAGVHPDDDTEAEFIPLITGSAAEFYIEPMLPLVGDVDVMYHLSTQLAIPQGHPSPTQLPAEFHSHVKIFEIVDSHLPGYVYLKQRYFLAECIENGKYAYTECDGGLLALNRSKGRIHGPAMVEDYGQTSSLLCVDRVYCVRCLSWPPQAVDWPIRHRNHAWLDSATVDRVVNNGCDVVRVAHRQYRHGEWTRKYQWRLSFSRAEIVLINGWMPIHQIVYHMLRVFMKFLLSNYGNNFEACVLNNYHIKTLMMWACELKSSGFWANDLNFIRMCVDLLHTLSTWLADAHCPHYFINDCNLVDNTVGVEMIIAQLNVTNETWLSWWFVNNYIEKCSMLCPSTVSRLFRNVSTNTKLQKAVSAVIRWRHYRELDEKWNLLCSAERLITLAVFGFALNRRSCISWMTELSKMDTRLTLYFTAAAFLHVAYRILKAGFTGELMDVSAIISAQFISWCTRRHTNQDSSQLSLSKATMLMKVVANNSRSTIQLIEIELSKVYLHSALKCKDCDSDSIYCLANVYLAVLYCTTRQYQAAIDHCTLVLRSQDHSQCSSRVVQGEILPKIDDDIDTVLGLAVFYQYVRTAALNQRQTQHVSVFTTKLFAHYLNISSLSVIQTLSNNDIYIFRNYFCNMQLLIADVLVVKSIVVNVQCQPINPLHVCIGQQSALNATDQNQRELVELLQQSAVEHLTAYRKLEARDFAAVATIATTDFEALYAYKRGDYQRCLQLSEHNVCSKLLYAICMPHVSTIREFIQLMDDDIVSLTALTLLVTPKCRQDSSNVHILQVTLSLYLITQCQLKLRHSMTSLAQTLDHIDLRLKRNPRKMMLDRLTLMLTKRKVMTYIYQCILMQDV